MRSNGNVGVKRLGTFVVLVISLVIGMLGVFGVIVWDAERSQITIGELFEAYREDRAAPMLFLRTGVTACLMAATNRA